MEPVYDHDGITVYHGDCRDVLPTLPTGLVDLVITSPPYNLGNSSGGGFPGKNGVRGPCNAHGGMPSRGGNGKWSGGKLAFGYGVHDDNMPHDEYVAWQKDILSACWKALSENGAIFYNHKPRIFDGECVTPLEYVPSGLCVRQILIWMRAGGVNFSPAFYLPTHEWILLIAKPAFRLKSQGASGVGDVWRIAQEGRTVHPAPFPLELPRRILSTTKPGAGVVLDPFAGSGTVGVACIKDGRRCILIEKDEQYIPLIVRRLQAAETPLFGSLQ